MSDGKDGESPPLLMALGAALNTEIKLVANCKIRSKKKHSSEDPFKSVIILIAKSGVFLFKKDLLNVKFHFEYKKVKNVKLEESNPNSIMIEFENLQMNSTNIPNIYLSIPDRDLFLNTFSCYYSTYYANFHLEVKDLKILKVGLIEFEHEVPLDDKYKVVYNQPPENFKLVKYNNYSFFLPTCFEDVGDLKYNFKISHRISLNNANEANNSEILNVSKSTANNNSKLKINNENSRQNDNIYIEKELECELSIQMQLEKSFQDSGSQSDLLRLEINAYSELINLVRKSYKMCKLFIYKDCPYVKRYNLAEDSSYWECWQIEALMISGNIKRKLMFYKLRRKYIPPFFDTLSDFSFLCMINCDELDDFQFIGFKTVHRRLYEMIETIVDSVNPDVVPNYMEFSTILEMKFDSLSLDYFSFMYYTQTLKIFGPETYHIGLKFVLRLMEIIRSSDVKAVENKLKNKFEKSKRDDEFIYKLKYLDKVYDMLKMKIQNYMKDKKIVDDADFSFKAKYNLKDVFSKFKSMLNLEEEKKKISNLEEFQGKQNEISKNWQERICVFLYFLLDGGIGSEVFDIEFILEYVSYDPTIKSKICEYIFPLLLKYYDGEQTIQQIKEIATSSTSVYNEILLCKLIKNGSLDLLFSSDEESDTFVVNLIKEKWNIEILESFYGYLDILVENDTPDKKRMENLLKSELKKILVNIYSDNSINTRISIVVCKILCFLCTYDSLGGLIEALINMNILEIIARKINTYDYIFLILNLSLLNLITAKINEQGLSETICNERLLIPELNKLMVDAKFYDNPAYFLKKPIDILLDILLSNHDIMQEKFREEIKIFPNNNICYNLVFHFLIIPVDYRDSQIFLKKFAIAEKVFHFFNCVIKLKPDLQKYFIETIDIMDTLSILFTSAANAFDFYYKNLKIKRDTATSSSIHEFVILLKSILRMFQFIFFLFENNRNYMENVIKQQILINLLNNMLAEINSDVMKKILIDPQNHLKDYESIIFSLQIIIKSSVVSE